ncbi:Na+/H+ antiporter subunit E [Salarchaeum japonicum]|uniref:Na+/H+ antiporter subunit E n=1 Tax=Salarchaeum japonicum TaxID=555573 RepID=A0AAV3T3U2_9EURY
MKLPVKRWQATGVALAVLWLFVRGVRFTARNLAQESLIGLALGLPTAYVFREFFTGRVNLVRLARTVPYAVLYIAVFLWELLTANFDVARRVVDPRLPIEPRVVTVPLRVERDIAITTIANSITLTPGTLTMDYDDDQNALYVHAMAATTDEEVIDPIRTWEDYALVIFDEELKPGDPVPERDAENGGESGGE